jgi:ribonuclease HI
MELLAIIRGLEAIKDKSKEVDVYTDSQYAIKGYSEYIYTWKSNGWKNSRKTEVKNRDLWEQLDREASKFGPRITFRHVRGHSGDEWNEFVDEMARTGAEIARSKSIIVPAVMQPEELAITNRKIATGEIDFE